MTVYVAEIDGRAVVAFNADNDLEAELEVEDEIFQNDLAVLESSGRPIGPARLFLRAEPSQHLALERSVFREDERHVVEL